MTAQVTAQVDAKCINAHSEGMGAEEGEKAPVAIALRWVCLGDAIKGLYEHVSDCLVDMHVGGDQVRFSILPLVRWRYQPWLSGCRSYEVG